MILMVPLMGPSVLLSKDESETPEWRSRKGFISQNALVHAGFNLEAYFALAGWEGSAHDARCCGG
jgi:hypothetical protein